MPKHRRCCACSAPLPETLPPRFFVEPPLLAGAALMLPDNAVRHVQVLRLQPGAALTLFDGQGGQWLAEIERIGRREVQVRVAEHQARECELARAVILAPAMPANERMDGLVEKATELGAAAIWPLVCERSVLRLAGERAERRAGHWRAIARAACEQSGRNRVPEVAAPQGLAGCLAGLDRSAPDSIRLLLSFAADALPAHRLSSLLERERPVLVLSGPEGGLSPAEESQARAVGFIAVSLGERVLRADTAPLAALAALALLAASPGTAAAT